AEVEQLVDAVLERLRPLQALGVTFSELAHPLRAHADVSDLVGEHVVYRSLDNRIAHLLRDANQLLEDVARQSLEAAIDPRYARGRILRLCARPQHFAFGKF